MFRNSFLSRSLPKTIFFQNRQAQNFILTSEMWNYVCDRTLKDAGDDVYGEDRIINELQSRVVKEIFEKQSALFFPTHQGANATAMMVMKKFYPNIETQQQLKKIDGNFTAVGDENNDPLFGDGEDVWKFALGQNKNTNILAEVVRPYSVFSVSLSSCGLGGSGSLLVTDNEALHAALSRTRKQLGMGMRQAGIMAASSYYRLFEEK
jgi:threonine aldolase